MANNMNRRKFLGGTAGTVLGTGLAGCQDDEANNDESSDIPQETGQEATGEPEFELEVNIPEQFEMDETSTASITVENTGNAQGQYETNYTVKNGETINQNIVTDELEPGNSQEIGLEEALNQLKPGEHRLEINDQTYDFDLLLDWGWEDVLQSEYQWAINNSETVIDRTQPDRTTWDVFETEKFREAVKSRDFPERLETTHPLIMNFTEQMMDELGDSSSVFSKQVNPITKRIYIEEEEKSRPSEGYSAGHGYNYKDNINDSLWLTDSNAPYKGPVEERPLQDRGSRSGAIDIIGRKFVDDNGNLIVTPEDLDFRGTAIYAGLPTKGLQVEDSNIDNTPRLAVHPDVAGSYNEDILEENDNELYWNRVRPALMALKYASEQGMMEESDRFNLTLQINDLPEFEGPIIGKYDEENEEVYIDEQLDREEFTEYVMELKDHLEFFETEDEYFDMLRSKAGQ